MQRILFFVWIFMVSDGSVVKMASHVVIFEGDVVKKSRHVVKMNPHVAIVKYWKGITAYHIQASLATKLQFRGMPFFYFRILGIREFLENMV